MINFDPTSPKETVLTTLDSNNVSETDERVRRLSLDSELGVPSNEEGKALDKERVKLVVGGLCLHLRKASNPGYEYECYITKDGEETGDIGMFIARKGYYEKLATAMATGVSAVIKQLRECNEVQPSRIADLLEKELKDKI